MKITVIIVSYNVKYYVGQCLDSLFRSLNGMEAEVFVVDNTSTDGTVDYLTERFPVDDYPDLHLISNSENVGFGKANNQAYARSTGDYVLFLNPDTILTEQTIANCLRFALDHPDMGGLGVRMLKSNGVFAYESRRGLPTPFTAFCKMSGLVSLFPRSRCFGRYYMRYYDEHQSCEIDVVSGAFLFCARKALQVTGAFDEDFFMYGEDIDLSYRLQKSGFHNYYISTPIIHYKGESTEKSSYRYVHVFYKAMLIFFGKHYKHYRMWVSIPIRLAIYVRALMALVHRKTGKLCVRTNEESDIKDAYLFIGRKAMLDEVKALAATYRLNAVFQEGDRDSLPTGHTRLYGLGKTFQVVVYDTDAYSMGQIISFFEGETVGERPQLGTYSTHTKTLITNYNIMTLWAKNG